MPDPVSASPGRLHTGIAGFDHLADGGLPRGELAVVSGTSGSGKTVFAVQFLAEGIRRGEAGVFVALEETPEQIRRHMAGFGWPITAWEAEGTWRFVDASRLQTSAMAVAGGFDLAALSSRIAGAVGETGAVRVAIDPVEGIFAQFPETGAVRRALLEVKAMLGGLGVTTVLTSERLDDYAAVSRYGVEEFVADHVVVLRYPLEESTRRRTVEILKFRGAPHRSGEAPCAIVPDSGIVVIPLSDLPLSSDAGAGERVTTGNADLDRLCDGGSFRGSIGLVAGPTGTGKTLLLCEFVGGGAAAGESCVVFDFEESREQLFREARGFGHDFAALERTGLLHVYAQYPESAPIEAHLASIKTVLEDLQPQRFAFDSLTAIERVATRRGFRDFLVALAAYVKGHRITTLFTAVQSLITGRTFTEGHISNLADLIVLLHHVETYGEVRRALNVLKLRGSDHDRMINEFDIDATGLHVRGPVRAIGGILAGNPVHISPSEVERLTEVFRGPASPDVP